MSEWQPMSEAPDFVRKQAEFFKPHIGELIYKNYPDMDGSIWVVRFDVPTSQAVDAFKLPKPPENPRSGATAMPQEVTDEMVERGVQCVRSEKRPGQDNEYVRWILETALNPPEIYVSSKMIDVAIEELAPGGSAENAPLWRAIERDTAAAMYRRMETQRRKEEAK